MIGKLLLAVILAKALATFDLKTAHAESDDQWCEAAVQLENQVKQALYKLQE